MAIVCVYHRSSGKKHPKAPLLHVGRYLAKVVVGALPHGAGVRVEIENNHRVVGHARKIGLNAVVAPEPLVEQPALHNIHAIRVNGLSRRESATARETSMEH